MVAGNFLEGQLPSSKFFTDTKGEQGKCREVFFPNCLQKMLAL
jgi:hypothetical protein